MNTNDYAAIADKYQAQPADAVPRTGVGMNGALDILRHLKADTEQQEKEPVRPMVPIVPLAN